MLAKRRVIVVGGGAAGFFAAIACAEKLGPEGDVTLYEATAHTLAKVRISGGGRCNVTHACFDPAELVKKYPRGGRELIGAFHHWQPRDTIAWFAARGVETKTEPDGRMFPVTDDSTTIVDCLRQAAQKAGVKLITGQGVRQVTSTTGGFVLELSNQTTVACERLLLATGGNKASGGMAIAAAFGHTIETPVPSLFTFHIKDARLAELAGLSVENAVVSVPGTRLRTDGPLLITHWGMSGPAILKLSAWGAREFAQASYRFPLAVNWVPSFTRESLAAELASVRERNAKKHIATWSPLSLPHRLWEKLVIAAAIAPATPWAQVGKTALNSLITQLTAGEFQVDGKSLFKEEFVTCGGIKLAEVDFKTMESRLCPGLHFAGEVLDIDGVTGGFNFQAAWTTGWLAGRGMAR